MQKMRLHPDLGGDELLAQRLNEAVATLCKADRRQQYDHWLAANIRATAPSYAAPVKEPTSKDTRSESGSPGSSNDEATGHEAPSSADQGDRIQLPRRKQCPFCHAAYPSTRTGAFGYQKNNHCAQCKGATTPIESISLGSADDIRKIYRLSHHSQVWMHTEWPIKTAISATMTDLSIAGCAIHCTSALTLQSVIMLNTPMLNSICQVRYQKPLGPTELYSIGLEFLTLDIFAGPGSVFSATA
jgi:hypothetical protein